MTVAGLFIDMVNCSPILTISNLETRGLIIAQGGFWNDIEMSAAKDSSMGRPMSSSESILFVQPAKFTSRDFVLESK